MTIQYDRKAYEDYLKSDKWKEFRKSILELNYSRKHKDKNYCEMCGWDFADFELEIHHINYNNLFNETMLDVHVLCKGCHIKADEIRSNETKNNRTKKESTKLFVHGLKKFMEMTVLYIWMKAIYGMNFKNGLKKSKKKNNIIRRINE